MRGEWVRATISTAKAFYAHTLELPLKADGESYGYCVFRSGSVELVVESVPADAPDEEQVLVGRFTGLSLTVPDIQLKYAQLRSKGVTFSGEPELQAWGGTLATFSDPSGNELQLVQQPAV